MMNIFLRRARVTMRHDLFLQNPNVILHIFFNFENTIYMSYDHSVSIRYDLSQAIFLAPLSRYILAMQVFLLG